MQKGGPVTLPSKQEIGHNPSMHQYPSIYFVSQSELIIYVFDYCWYQLWEQVLLFVTLFYCNDQLIPQLHELFEIRLSQYKILDQAKGSVISLQQNSFYILLSGDFLDQKKFQRCLYVFQIHMEGKEYFIVHNHDKLCVSPQSRNHFSLLGIVEGLLQKMDPLRFFCQNWDFFKHSQVPIQLKESCEGLANVP